MLTKSTLNGGADKYLPKIESGAGQPPPNGYISDFYKKKNYASDGSHKVGMQIGSMQQNAAVGSDYPGGNFPTHGNPAQKLNKISSKKFFKSKIDFKAPIQSL